jgi:hypothetical protein
MVATPQWASDMVREVCHEYERDLPELVCRQSRIIAETSGSMTRTQNRIVVTFGTQGHDHRQVLLHELAHYLNRKGGHGQEFYTILKRLLVQYNCLTEEYRERQYRGVKRSRLYL